MSWKTAWFARYCCFLARDVDDRGRWWAETLSPYPSTSTAHFAARYTLGSDSDANAKIYTYDGMLHGGFSVEESEGFKVYTAVYCLQGGTLAQDRFFTQRTHALANIFNLHTTSWNLDILPTLGFRDPTLVEMDPHGEYILPHSPSATRYSIESSTPHFFPSSPPDSEFQLNCRCGFHGDGNKFYRKEEGTAIQCDECKDWSHVACQRNGRASGLGEKQSFVCDLCSLATVAVAQKRDKP